MKTKDNKGITLIALIMTIILMLILLSVTTYTGLNAYRNAQVTKFVAQMQLIQTKVDDLVDTKTIDELQILGEDVSVITNGATILDNAFSNEEIFTKDTTTNIFRYFSEQKILEELGIEYVQNGVIINFTTREVISITGIEYEGDTYYTQYKLPGGQTIINSEGPLSRNVSFNLEKSVDGLNCTITINNCIANGTLSFAEMDEEGNYTNWKTITNYTQKDNDYIANISKSGNYTFKLNDNTNDNNFEELVSITLTNKPNTTTVIQSYDYDGLISENWAYAQKDNVNYVWIPRFVYKNNTETNTKEIKFIKGNSNIATNNTYIEDNDWNIHDKFTTDDGIELTGLWVSVDNVKQTGLNIIDDLLNDNTRTILIEI